MRPMIVKLMLLVVAGTVSAVAADIIRLTTGEVIEGNLKRIEQGWIVTLPDGAKREIPADLVQRVELKPATGEGPRGEALALSRLDSLRQSVRSSGDLGWIIDRYVDFLDQYKDTLAAEKARDDLGQWRRREAAGLVRLGEQWVTAQRRDELRIEATTQAAEARQLIKQGQPAQARMLIATALATDPENVTALYLRGLLEYEQDRLSEARQALETAAAKAEDHGPTLNNLAVVAWRQRRTLDAVALYDQAMAAAPENERILQNVAEALHALPREQQDSAIVQRAHRRFQAQDAALRVGQEKLGRFRWGSQFVVREEYESLRAREQEIRLQLEGLAREFADVEDAIRRIADQIASNEAAMREIYANSFMRSWTGFLYRTPLPSVYYELQHENDGLRRDRQDALATLERLRVEAQRVEKQVPRPRFTGLQTMIGVEGTPLGSPLAAATDDGRGAMVPERGPESSVVIGPPERPTTQPAE